MRYWTYAEIKKKVAQNLDLEDETFIEDDEMLDFANEAIDEAEAEIHSIYEDYFLTSTSLALVTGQSTYSLPTDIYANKIRGLIYRNGPTIFPIPRIKDWHKFERIAYETSFPTTLTYCYILTNSSAATGPELQLFPPSKETSSSNVTLWYLRNANRLVNATDKCDIPEFTSFVIQFMKVRCYEKEGHPNLQFAVAALEKQRALMAETLTEMVPDGDTNIEMDLTLYNEMN